jgi:aquaporin Z
MQNGKKYVAEILGTAVLVFVACGVAIVSGGDLVAIALGFGLVIVAMAYSIGPISGCHINPAVSLGAAIGKRISWKQCFGYMLAQVIGACIGGFLLYSIVQMANISALGLGQNYYSNGLLASSSNQIAVAFMIEVILTFVFVFTILGVTSKVEYEKKAGIVIGATLALVHLIGINFTGTSVNPARSLGVAFYDGLALSQVWLFILAPLSGGLLAGLASWYFFPTKKTK